MIQGRFRADPYKDNMGVSMSWGSCSVGVLMIRALLLVVYIRRPDCWKFLFDLQLRLISCLTFLLIAGLALPNSHGGRDASFLEKALDENARTSCEAYRIQPKTERALLKATSTYTP